jgi:diguanylate cyclase (GGDEF)-like protein
VLHQTVATYLKAFGRSFTYNPLKNHYVGFGFLWGSPIPIVCLAMDIHLGPAGRTVLQAIVDHPVHLVFFAHPLLFGLIFGAMGTVRHKLEEENARLIQSLTDLATTDLLTGLHNRRYVLNELDKAIQRSRRPGHRFSLVLFDLDGFKGINDTQGHPAGDVVLKKASEALQSVCREGDVLGRYGGDEFLLIAFGDPPDEESLPIRADEAVLRQAGLGTSAGIAYYPQDGDTEGALIACADQRLAEAKQKRYALKGTARRGTESQKSTPPGE